MGEAQPDRWKAWADLADIISKVLIGGAVAYTGYILTVKRDDFEVDKTCTTILHSLFTIVPGKNWGGDTINEIVNAIPQRCPKTGTLQNILVTLSNSNAGQRPASPGGATDVMTSKPLPPVASGAAKSAEGWVAVGFVGTSNFNFDLANGRPITDLPKIGDVLRPRWQVNIRPHAADWRDVTGVLPVGQCFKVTDSPRVLTAGDQKQIWAPGQAESCP